VDVLIQLLRLKAEQGTLDYLVFLIEFLTNEFKGGSNDVK